MRPLTRLKFKAYDNFHWLVVLGAIIVFSLFCLFLKLKINDPTIWLTVLGGFGSAVYLLQKQRLDEMNSFRELFNRFNERYGQSNETLNEIMRMAPDELLSQKQKDTLNDYFDLCSEEYLFCKKGYIYPEVWGTWCKGMLYYFCNPAVNKIWQDEEKKNSYYELTIEKIKESATCRHKWF